MPRKLKLTLRKNSRKKLIKAKEIARVMKGTKTNAMAKKTEKTITPATIPHYETTAKQKEEICIKREPAEIVQNNSADDEAIFDSGMDYNAKDISDQTMAETYEMPIALRSTTPTDTEILAKQRTSTERPLRAAKLSKSGFWKKNYLDNPDYESAILYVCPACEREYFSQKAWKRHLNVQHNFNTREGLNFDKVNKWYCRCRQCSKNIVMRGMDNLLRHKFIHLPFRSAKCRICLSEYRNRLDVVVHLRMYHIPELEKILKTGQWEHENQALRVRDKRDHLEFNTNSSIGRLAIMNIQENAVDLHGDASLQKSVYTDSVCVQNERLVLDDEDEDEVQFVKNRERNLPYVTNTDAVDAASNYDKQLCEPYIMHLCPQCDDAFEKQADWQRHIELEHTPVGLG